MECKLIAEKHDSSDFSNQPESCQIDTDKLDSLDRVLDLFKLIEKRLKNIKILLDRNKQISRKT